MDIYYIIKNILETTLFHIHTYREYILSSLFRQQDIFDISENTLHEYLPQNAILPSNVYYLSFLYENLYL